uniref:Uncharacterized protein n=1 Tax=Noctiluca scintillans TaxID=2966 RepID=A0A7S1ANY7_NOCSC
MTALADGIFDPVTVGNFSATPSKETAAWKVHLTQASNVVTWKHAAELFSSNEGLDFRILLRSVMRAVPFDAFFWECPPLSRRRWHSQPFEFVFVNSPTLARTHADGGPFHEHLNAFQGQVASRAFFNLGGDSLLVAPAQAGRSPDAYAHIASFFRYASEEEADVLWRTLGWSLLDRMQQVGADIPVWVSTEGSGVSWLHLRMDLAPKYYHWFPYCSWPEGSDL